jgi:hypothetical protein
MSGSDLYLGGDWIFRDDDTSPACHLAQWDGSQWSALGSGVDWGVAALAVSGSHLYVGGSLQTAGGKLSTYLARWDGLSPDADTVGDGISDTWRQQYFGGTGTESNLASAADADPDGDGMTNWQEFLAGTDPTSAASVFRTTTVAVQGRDLVLSWRAGGGRTNVVQVAEGSSPGGFVFHDLSAPLVLPPGGDVVTNFVDAGAATNAMPRYYRIRLAP